MSGRSLKEKCKHPYVKLTTTTFDASLPPEYPAETVPDKKAPTGYLLKQQKSALKQSTPSTGRTLYTNMKTFVFLCFLQPHLIARGALRRESRQDRGCGTGRPFENAVSKLSCVVHVPCLGIPKGQSMGVMCFVASNPTPIQTKTPGDLVGRKKVEGLL